MNWKIEKNQQKRKGEAKRLSAVIVEGIWAIELPPAYHHYSYRIENLAY